MDELTLVAETGRPLGTRPARRLRRDGKVPAVVYGLGTQTVSIAVNARALRAALSTDAGANALITLQVDGEEHVTLARELQRDPVRHTVTHADFVLVNLDEDVQVEVPIHLEGEAEEVHRENGTIEQVLFTLAVSCKPTNIPSGISIDVSNMTVGDTIKVGDLPIPEGVTTELDPEEPVATAQVTRATLEAEAAELAAEEEAAEAAAEGEEGEAAAGDEGAGDDKPAESAEGDSE